MPVGMFGAIFAVALLLALGVAVGRAWRRAHGRRQNARQPGRSPSTAVRFTRFDEIDAVVHAARCACGGILEVAAEGSREIEGETLRVVHTECARCETAQDLFFRGRVELSGPPH